MRCFFYNKRKIFTHWCLAHESDRFDQDMFISNTSLKPLLTSLSEPKGALPLPTDMNAPKRSLTSQL
jgi:hypothetical protein